MSRIAFWGYENAENEYNEALNKKVQNGWFVYSFRISTFDFSLLVYSPNDILPSANMYL